jgi:hypothetical protein
MKREKEHGEDDARTIVNCARFDAINEALFRLVALERQRGRDCVLAAAQHARLVRTWRQKIRKIIKTQIAQIN